MVFTIARIQEQSAYQDCTFVARKLGPNTLTEEQLNDLVIDLLLSKEKTASYIQTKTEQFTSLNIVVLQKRKLKFEKPFFH